MILMVAVRAALGEMFMPLTYTQTYGPRSEPGRSSGRSTCAISNGKQSI